MSRHLHQIAIVAASTLGSRVLGLLRDVMMMALLGAGPAASAFLFAFTVPNLFRRLLGEGALTSALVPVFSETLTREGKSGAFRFANQALGWTARTLVVFMLLGVLAYSALGLAVYLNLLPFAWALEGRERVLLGCVLGAILIPYMLLICLAAAQGAVLNVLHRFAVHALSSVWLNLAMIVALLVGLVWKLGPLPTAYLLAAAVLVGGVVQLVVPMMVLRGEGWRWTREPADGESMTELRRLFFPAVGGAAIMQINILVSRVLGFSLSDAALPALYLASRLVELPLGVFAIAVATVLFPSLSLHVASGDRPGLARSFGQGLRLILAVTAPAAVGLAVLAGPVLGLLFEWGRFDQADVSVTRPVLVVFALAMPFYAAATFVTRGFHAMKDTRTPVRVAAWSFAINLVLSLSLIGPLGAVGLALANLVSSGVQTVMLVLYMRGKSRDILSDLRVFELVKVSAASVLMGLACWFGAGVVSGASAGGKLTEALSCALIIPLGVGSYLALLWLMRFSERRDALDMLVKMVRRR